MNKRIWAAVLGTTLVTIAPPFALGYLLFRVWNVSLLHASPLILAVAIVTSHLCQRLITRLKPWAHGYEACIDLTLKPGAKIPQNTRFQGKDANDVWETVKDQYADAEGKVCLKLNRVRA